MDVLVSPSLMAGCEYRLHCTAIGLPATVVLVLHISNSNVVFFLFMSHVLLSTQTLPA